jgi:hypothetical protein
LVKTYPDDVSREALVTIAGLGLAHELRDVRKVLEEVLAVTRLSHIDMVVVHATPMTFAHSENFAATLKLLDELCTNGPLSCFGLHVSVPPYTSHTPIKKTANDFSAIPMMLEHEVSALQNCGLILYDVAPSHHTPATYPMLDHPDKDLWVQDDEVGGEIDSKPQSFSRAAVDPLTCYRGLGPLGDESDDVNEAELKDLEAAAELIPPPDKEEGYAFMDPSYVAGPSAESLAQTEQTENDHQPLILLSGVLPPQLEHSIGLALNELCPKLQAVSRLEDKAIMIGLSVGTDAVVIEGNQSAKLQKLSIDKRLLLGSDDTVDVFGSFIVPFTK